MNLEELQAIIFNAGIVGAGGAGFPTHKKLSKGIKQIVVNAAECEPLMMVDHHIFRKHFQSIIDTLNVILDVLGADEAIFGIKGKNMHLLDSKIVENLKGTRISVKEIPDIYPAGDEVVLVYETTGKIIPEGAIPVSVGVMVINTETLYNIKKALELGETVCEKYVTIAGDTKEDITIKVPVGMKIKELFEALGYSDMSGKAIINGGPMMGKLMDYESDVVTKTTKGLLVFPETHSVIQRRKMPVKTMLKRASAACCYCTMCTDVCPRHLLGHSIEVHKILRSASHCEVNDADAFLQSTLCCGCGVCTVIGCQQMLNPQEIAMRAKEELAKKGYRRTESIKPDAPRPEREGRLVPSETLIDRLGIRKYVKDKVERRYIDFYPDTVYIPMSQHIGKPASAIVNIGDKVKKGQMIAKTDGNALGTSIHASIDGVVKSVSEKEIVISVK